LQIQPTEDWAHMVRDDATWEAVGAANGHLFHPEFECSVPLLDSARTYSGLDGLREAWRDWLAPWASYRSEIEEAVDLGDDRVLLLLHDYGRREGSEHEVRGSVAAIWTVRDGKAARFDAYADRAEALRVAGLVSRRDGQRQEREAQRERGFL
jgi:ketosteroid isomerase-like protein